MDAPSLNRTASLVVIGGGGLLWLSAILFMAQTAQHSAQFSRLHPWILMSTWRAWWCCSACW